MSYGSFTAFQGIQAYPRLYTMPVNENNTCPTIFWGAEHDPDLRFVRFHVERYVPECFYYFPAISARSSHTDTVDIGGHNASTWEITLYKGTSHLFEVCYGVRYLIFRHLFCHQSAGYLS